MLANHSSSTNISIPQIDFFLLFLFNDFCFNSVTAIYIFFSYSFTNFILQLPLSTFTLYIGYQRWKQQQSSAPISPSDFYTYNMAVMELIGVLGVAISFFRSVFNFAEILFVGFMVTCFPWTAQMLFPVMICVERYQAVVHPIAYMRQRRAGGVCMRNISTGLVWLLCFAGLGLLFPVMKYSMFNFLLAGGMAFCLIIIIFCCLSVLCVLIRPQPGKVGGDRTQADQSKRRACKTIAIIMGVLLFKFAGNLIFYLVNFSLHGEVHCVIRAFQAWISVPSSLVLPLLFLHRTGKLPGWKHSSESG